MKLAIQKTILGEPIKLQTRYQKEALGRETQTSPHINDTHGAHLFIPSNPQLSQTQPMDVSKLNSSKAIKENLSRFFKKIYKTKYLDSGGCPGEFFQLFKEKRVEILLSSRKQKRKEQLPTQCILRGQHYSGIQTT